MAVTGRISNIIGKGECLLRDWQNAGLLKPSSVKPVISTIEQTMVLKKLGNLSEKDSYAVKDVLKELLDLNR